MKKILIFVLLIIIAAPMTFAGQVVLDHTNGTWFDGTTEKIIPGNPVDFYIRYINDDAVNVTGIVNGFSVSSDGFFTPVTIESFYSDPFIIFGDFPFNSFSCDGAGADTVGFQSYNLGLPVFYAGDETVPIVIHTGNFDEGSTVCLDSSYYPPSGSWMWYPTGPPDWGGPYCFSVEQQHYLPQYDFCPGEITIHNCNFMYPFTAHNTVGDDSTVRYGIVSGPGSMNEMNGRWSYTPTQSDFGTTQTLTVKTYNSDYPQYSNQCTTQLTFVDQYVPGDVDYNCNLDIADLVYMGAYMFMQGPEPPYYYSFDVNSDGKLDIADVVYMVNYMFVGGPPPVG